MRLENVFDQRQADLGARRSALAEAAARLPRPSFAEKHAASPEQEAGNDAVAVPEALCALLPDGLRRGVVVGLDDDGYLAAALVGAAVAAGGSAALVGSGDLGVEAVLAAGAAPQRLVLVDVPPSEWAAAVEALIGAVDVLLLRPPGPVSDAIARQITGRLRRAPARTVLLAAGGQWPAPLRLRVQGATWIGLGDGHGQLSARRAAVLAEGHGTYGRPRVARVWAPAFDGRLREYTDPAALPQSPHPPLHLVADAAA